MPVATSNTAYGIIADAYHDAGMLAETVEPNSDQLIKGLRYLCDVINYVQLKGVKLFLTSEVTVDLVTGTASYTVNPTVGLVPTKHLSVLQGYVQETNSRRPLIQVSHKEWMELPTALVPVNGTVTKFWVDKQTTSMLVYFWPSPDATDAAFNAIMLVRGQAVNPINLEANVSFPQEWRLSLRWLLADELCTGQPAEIMNRCRGKAKEYREALEDFDVEDGSVTFSADISQAYGGSSFR